MELRLVTVAFDPELQEFPEKPLAEIEGEIISVVEHFFHYCDQPHLLLVVHVRPVDEKWRRPRRRKGKEWRDTLSPEEGELFDRLRAWRNGLAQSEGVPPYVILTNQQAARISSLRPANLESLRQIDGIGEAKSSRYGRQILQVVAQALRERQG
ncbi:MAG: HRDC domain-containing protein [Acidobacteriota bacterium]